MYNKEYYGMLRSTHSVFTHAFQAKRKLQYMFISKRAIIIASKHSTTIFFSHYNLFLGKNEKLARKACVNTDASISDHAHAPWVSHNTPQIQLIQYGCCICKKVYWTKCTIGHELRWLFLFFIASKNSQNFL